MDKLELTTGRLERNIEERGETLIQISLQHPAVVGGDEGPFGALSRCLSQAAENLATALSQCMLGEARAAAHMLPETLPYQLSGTFSTTYNAQGVLSFFTDVFLYAGGMRGITYRYGASFLTSDELRPLFLTSLFPAGTDVCAAVTDFIAARQGRDAAAIRAAFSPENIYLTDSGLAVFFAPGSVGPVAGGIAVFTVPYGDEGPYAPGDIV